MQSRARVYPRGSPTRLRHIFLGARALATRAFVCFIYTNREPRLFYFSEYEILTASDRCTELLGSFLFGRRDSHFGCVTRPLKVRNYWKAGEVTSEIYSISRSGCP